MNFDYSFFSRAKEAWKYRNEPEQAHVLGMLFWRALLLFAFVVFVASLWFGIQELNAVLQVESAGIPSTTAPAPFDRTQLDSTLNALSARQAEFQTLSHSPAPAVSDPSK